MVRIKETSSQICNKCPLVKLASIVMHLIDMLMNKIHFKINAIRYHLFSPRPLFQTKHRDPKCLGCLQNSANCNPNKAFTSVGFAPYSRTVRAETFPGHRCYRKGRPPHVKFCLSRPPFWRRGEEIILCTSRWLTEAAPRNFKVSRRRRNSTEAKVCFLLKGLFTGRFWRNVTNLLNCGFSYT